MHTNPVRVQCAMGLAVVVCVAVEVGLAVAVCVAVEVGLAVAVCVAVCDGSRGGSVCGRVGAQGDETVAACVEVHVDE